MSHDFQEQALNVPLDFNFNDDDVEHDNYIYIKYKKRESSDEMSEDVFDLEVVNEKEEEGLAQASGYTPEVSSTSEKHTERGKHSSETSPDDEDYFEPNLGFLGETLGFLSDRDLGSRDEERLRTRIQQLVDEQDDFMLQMLEDQLAFGVPFGHIPVHLLGQDDIDVQREPDYPRNQNEKGMCEICCEDDIDVRKRLCCEFSVCEGCLCIYLKNEVEQRNVRILCLNCPSYVHRDEILALLPAEVKEKYYRFLIEENKDPNVKTCPRCCVVQKRCDIMTDKVSPKTKSKKATGLKVTCQKCILVWCFDCHAPWHENLKCKEFRKGDKLVKNWAKEVSYGQKNAVKCPKCKIFIQKKSGCSHMTCSNCHTSFCYRCGHRYLQMKFIGAHSERFSPLGCKYNLLPNRPVARKFVRGSILCGKILGGIGLGSLAIAAIAVLIGGSAIFVPTYFGVKYYSIRKRRKLHEKYRMSRLKCKHVATQGVDPPINARSVNDLELGSVVEEKSDTLTSTESSSSNNKPSTEVKVWVHSEVNEKPIDVVELKSQEQQTTTTKNHDNTITTAEVTMENDVMVLHVKTTQTGEETQSKQEVDGTYVANVEEGKEENTEINQNDLVVDSQGCFVKILGKLPVKWEKDEDVKVKDTVVTSKPVVVKDKKKRLASRRHKSFDVNDLEKLDGVSTVGNDDSKHSEIQTTLNLCDQVDPYYGVVAMETCDTGF